MTHQMEIDLQLFADEQQPKTYTEDEMKKIVSDQVQTRVKELNTKYGPAHRVSEKLLSAYGMKSVDDLEKEIDAALNVFKQQGVQQTPAVSPQDVATQAALKAQEVAREASLSVEEANLLAKADYADVAKDSELRQKLKEYAKKNEVSLETAFWALQGPEKAAKIRDEVKQQTIDEMKAKIARGGSLDDNVSTAGSETKLSGEEREAARFMRIGDNEFSELNRDTGDDGTRYNIDDYLRYKEKGKGRG